MNGRVYDYNLGRFMSVDPFIQAPTSTQSVNPYSYIMNNPLAGTDPTGYEGVMTGSRIEGVDTGASGAAFGAKAEMGTIKADSGASKSQSTQQASSTATQQNVAEVGGLKQNAAKGDSGTNQSQSGWGVWDSIQTGLDVVGMVPILGEVADFANAGISVARGDYEGAALSMAAMVPFVGNAAGAAKIARSADKAIDAIPLKNNSARKLLMARGATPKQAREVVSSFDGQIYATKGKAGDVFTITETKSGSASGMFVTRGSAGGTPAERIQNLALPMSNTARVQGSATLTRSQVLLEGRVASQVGNRGFGPNATGGGRQVVTDAFNGGIRR
jgi:hypothetical protein